MIKQRYVLVITRGKGRQVLEPLNLNDAAKVLGFLHEEGYGEVQLWILEPRQATQEEMQKVISRTVEFMG